MMFFFLWEGGAGNMFLRCCVLLSTPVTVTKIPPLVTVMCTWLVNLRENFGRNTGKTTLDWRAFLDAEGPYAFCGDWLSGCCILGGPGILGWWVVKVMWIVYRWRYGVGFMQILVSFLVWRKVFLLVGWLI